MASFRIIKLVFSFVVLIAIIGIGGGFAYMEHKPESAAAYALGTMAVDPKASYLDQARQMIHGYKAADQAIEDTKTAQAKDDEFAERSQGFIHDRYGALDDGSGHGSDAYGSDPDPVSEAPVEE